MTITLTEIFSIVIAVLSFLGSVGMLVLNLSIKANIAASNLKLERDIAKVELQISNLRAEFVKEISVLYQSIMTNANTQFMSRNESITMHAENKGRLDRIESKLNEIDKENNGNK